MEQVAILLNISSLYHVTKTYHYDVWIVQLPRMKLENKPFFLLFRKIWNHSTTKYLFVRYIVPYLWHLHMTSCPSNGVDDDTNNDSARKYLFVQSLSINFIVNGFFVLFSNAFVFIPFNCFGIPTIQNKKESKPWFYNSFFPVVNHDYQPFQ